MSKNSHSRAPERSGYNPIRWLGSRYRVRLIRRSLFRTAEIVRFAFIRPQHTNFFHIVSTQRNAGSKVLDCLDSVERQDYPKAAYRHLLIDDNSSDATPNLIVDWCSRHPRHRVEVVTRSERYGGTWNTLDGIRPAESESIVIELNGDDQLPDPGVLAFLNKVYQDPNVWMTYNTQRHSNGVIPIQLPPPRTVRQGRTYRYCPWSTSHLHTFRRRLFDHVPEEVMIDPETGELWQSADDVALYLWMLELAGDHARHIWRITCLYNFHEQTEERLNRRGQLERAERIRRGSPANELDAL